MKQVSETSLDSSSIWRGFEKSPRLELLSGFDSLTWILMKNIRHKYTFHFTGRGINTIVEIKGETLREVYHKLLHMEPALQRLDDRAWNCSITEEHKRRSIPIWYRRSHTRNFLPCNIMSEKDYNRVLYGH